MNYADIKRIDVANGPGIRVSIFVSGCTHCCKNCFNPETWDFGYGKTFTNYTIDEIIGYMKSDWWRSAGTIQSGRVVATFKNNKRMLSTKGCLVFYRIFV